MARLTQDELLNLIIQWVRENGQTGEFPDQKITAETDLMAAGLLDSFGFIDLVLFLEAQCGARINLAEVDPGEFTVVMGLCNIALAGMEPDPLQPPDDLAFAGAQPFSD